MTTLEKVRKLERYLALLDPESEPVIDMAIDKLLVREGRRLRDLEAALRAQLAEFERRYGMSTEAFCRQFDRGEVGDAMDYLEWSSTSQMLRNVEKHLRLLADETNHESAH